MDQIELEETAESLVEFITSVVAGKTLVDPRGELKACLASFFTNNPKAQKFQHRMDVEGTVVATPKGNAYWITHVKVICQ